MNNDIVIWLNKNVTFVTTDVIKIIIACKEWLYCNEYDYDKIDMWYSVIKNKIMLTI